MTMTESPPAAEAAESTEPAGALPGAGLYDALTTSDHKRIGRMWLGLGLLMLAAATVLGVANAWVQFVTSHRARPVVAH